MIAIKCSNISKVYRHNIVGLDNLHLEVEANTIFAFVGPNGAGKTTTMNILTGLIQQTRGHAWIFDEKVAVNNFRLKSQIGYLSQDPLFYKWMTAKELLLFVGRLFRIPAKVNTSRVDKLLEMSGLKEASKRRLAYYSRGMLQRLGIAQALMNNPKVLFLDEPCSSLDPFGRKDVLEFISRIKKDTTVFMSTHILGDAERICDIVGIIDKGRMIVVDKLKTLKESLFSPQLELSFERTEDVDIFKKMALNSEWHSNITERNDKCLAIAAKNLPLCRSEALRLIAINNLSLSKMAVASATLEDVFIKLVKGA